MSAPGTAIAETIAAHQLWIEGTGGARADLTGADLRGADLTGADLQDCCLSHNLSILSRSFCRACPPLRTGGRIVWRTRYSRHIGNAEYVPGKTYVAPVLSWSVETACHPGIYAGSKAWIHNEYAPGRCVPCYVRDGEWTITAKGVIRCKRIRVLTPSRLEALEGLRQRK